LLALNFQDPGGSQGGVRLRVAALLRAVGLGTAPLEIYQNVRRAYQIRSKFVHGSSVTLKDQASARSLGDATLESARLSLVVFLTLAESLPRSHLVAMLDDALLDDGARNRLGAAAAGVVDLAGARSP